MNLMPSLGALWLALGLSPSTDQTPVPLALVIDTVQEETTRSLHFTFRDPFTNNSDASLNPECDWVFLRGGGEQHNLSGNPTSVIVPASLTGLKLMAIDFRPKTREIDAESMARRWSLNTELPESGTWKVRHYHSMKSLVRWPEDPSTGSATALSKTGQASEIRWMADPTTTPCGSALPFKVYVGGSSASDARVMAVSSEESTRVRGQVDASGVGTFTLPHGGEWRVISRVLRPLQDGSARWALHTSTTSFHAPSEEGQ